MTQPVIVTIQDRDTAKQKLDAIERALNDKMTFMDRLLLDDLFGDIITGLRNTVSESTEKSKKRRTK